MDTISWNSQHQHENTTVIKKDFVTHLPYDAISTIFRLCTFRECIQFTQVSLTWRLFLLNWPGLWENMTDAKCNYGKLLKLAPATLQGRHVHKVDVQDKSKEEQRVVLEYLKKMNSNALDLCKFLLYSFLYILSYREEKQVQGNKYMCTDLVPFPNNISLVRIASDSNDIHTLKEVLQISGASLKQLDIKIKGDPRYIRLVAVILKNCHSHRLTHL